MSVRTVEEARVVMGEICDLIVEYMPKVEELRYRITVKEDGSLVTEADVMLEQLIFNYIQNKLDKVVFIGEESYDFKQVAEDHYVVMVDPIDGTENFCTGLKEWGVAFCIWKSGQHLGSLLFMPELNERLMTGDELERLPVPSRMTALSVAVNEKLLEILGQKGQYRMSGCSVYNLYYVIKGTFSTFLHPKGAYVWDILPGILLALEHGCQVWINEEPFNGQFLDPSKKYRVEVRR